MKIQDLIRPFVEISSECFDSMMDTKLTFKGLDTGEHRFKMNGVYALIGLSGDAQISLGISFPDNVALELISRFIGEEVTEVDDAACDAVGEILNIIAGAKSKFNNIKLTMSLPTVLYGQPLIISQPRDVPVVKTTFEAEGVGEVYLFICLQQ